MSFRSASQKLTPPRPAASPPRPTMVDLVQKQLAKKKKSAR